MKLERLLNRDCNNIDLFRIIAAFMVIYSHAYVISPEVGRSELLGKMIGVADGGSLAVMVFFFLSGLVVTNSILDKKNPTQFLIARFFRIWPAFSVTVIVTALVIGPLVTNLTLIDYFSHVDVYRYIYQNIFMRITFYLPGVFESNPYKAVNGSLWTIPYEVSAYICIAILSFIGFFKKRIFSFSFLALVVLDPLFSSSGFSQWLPIPVAAKPLALSFLFGSFLAVYKDKININIAMLIFLWLSCFLFRQSIYYTSMFFVSIFISVLYLSSLNIILRFKPRYDISYGIYLWGFPVQQIIALYFHQQGVVFNQLVSIVLCLFIGLLSWLLIEKPSIHLGRRFAARFDKKCSAAT